MAVCTSKYCCSKLCFEQTDVSQNVVYNQNSANALMALFKESVDRLKETRDRKSSLEIYASQPPSLDFLFIALHGETR